MSDKIDSPEMLLQIARRTADKTLALKYYLQAAEGGLSPAMVAVGNIYLEGEAVAKDDAEALDWFKKAAALGNPVAMNNIGYIYEQRDDNELAVKWYTKAAKNGDTVALRNLAFTYAKIGELDKAVTNYKKAIERGDVEAMNDLGDLYFENEDYEEAEDYYMQAAKLGHVEAMVNLGQMLIYGEDFLGDSYYWLKKAFDKGHEYAPMLLGELFEEHRKYRKAARWYKRAVDFGISDANKKLREMKAYLKKNENADCKILSTDD